MLFISRILLVSALGALGFAAPIGAMTRAETLGVTGTPRVYAIVTVHVKPGKNAAFLKMMRGDVAQASANGITALSTSGIKSLGGFQLQFGRGDRNVYVDFWEGPDAETMRRAWYNTNIEKDVPGIWDIIESDDVEMAERAYPAKIPDVAKPGFNPVYAIATVQVKPGKNAMFMESIKIAVKRLAEAGVNCLGVYQIQWGRGDGNMYVVLWQSDDEEKMRHIFFDASSDKIFTRNEEIFEKESDEVAVRVF